MSTLAPARVRLVKLMAETLADQSAHNDWTYRAVRPMPVPATWREGQRVTGDCSKGVQYLCHWGGAPDPMGNGWGPYGNSQTICLRLQHVASPGDLEPGDVVTFGVYGSEHAAMVYAAGADPVLWSFGHQGAPNQYRLSQDRRVRQFLRLPVIYVPTPADKLRATTGWWAWVAWKLGEGDWRHRKPADPVVRPDVPKVISAAWWARYAEFLANRKKAN
jgi:hypothetical protein